MKNSLILIWILTLSCNYTFGQKEKEAREICKKFIKEGRANCENKKINGYQTGYWVYYFDVNGIETNKSKKAEIISLVYYEFGLPKGICVDCYPNSSLRGYGTCIDSNLTIDGLYSYFDENGALFLEENYTKGKLHGLTTYYYKSGKLLTESFYSNGKLHGVMKEYYRNGALHIESFYSNDSLKMEKYYFRNGDFGGSKEYAYNPDTVVVINKYRRWDKSKIIYERKVNGKDDGEYFIYYKDGSVKLEAKSIKGIRVMEKIYDKEGNLKKEGVCNELTLDCMGKIYNKKGNIVKVFHFEWRGTKIKWEF